jgi:hypothetical protein
MYFPVSVLCRSVKKGQVFLLANESETITRLGVGLKREITSFLHSLELMLVIVMRLAYGLVNKLPVVA